MSFKCDLLAFPARVSFLCAGRRAHQGQGHVSSVFPSCYLGRRECCRLDAVRVIEIEDESVKKSVACEVR